jgi:flagellar motor switch protein FliG
MATENTAETSGRIVRSVSLEDAPLTGSSQPWKPNTLVARSGINPIEMHLGQKDEAAEKEKRSSAYLPEPGMVLIQAGEFKMGSDEGGKDESPEHTVLLNAFWIDQYPVTNAQYKAFVDDTDREPQPWAKAGYPLEKARHPATDVSWEDAKAFAAWAGKRLPTEAEWEKAARGTQGRTYPYGDAFRRDNINSSNDYSGTTPVDEFPGGASPSGVLDMCGNVLEWCEDWYFDEYYNTSPLDNPTGPQGGQYRVARGGFYGERRQGVRCTSRHFAPPSNRQDHIGFRCAKTPLLAEEKAPQRPVVARPEARKPRSRRPGSDRTPISPDESIEQIVARWPESIAKLIGSLLLENRGKKIPQDAGAARELTDIGILILGLGSDLSAEIMKYLGNPELEDIARIVSELKTITVKQRDEVFETFRNRLVSGDYLIHGGNEFARQTLEKALGPRKAQMLMDRVDTTERGFHLLRHFDPVQIVPFLAKEHPQTIALILSQLDPVQAAAVLDGLDEELQTNVTHRIAKMENISPQVLRRLEETLAQELQTILAGQITEIGGPKAVAEILNYSARNTEKAILESLDKQNAPLAEEVRNQMFVFDDIVKLTDREIQEVLRNVDMKDLAIALKGGIAELRERIIANVSESVAKELAEEMEFSGPVRTSDVEAIQLRIVQSVRRLEEEGKITITRGDKKDVFI